jgi:hypothetical protein
MCVFVWMCIYACIADIRCICVINMTIHNNGHGIEVKTIILESL